MKDWLMMGGHGVYVWSAYAAFLSMIIYNVVIPARRHRQLLDRVRRAIILKGKKSK